jgi:hypothetical protein
MEFERAAASPEMCRAAIMYFFIQQTCAATNKYEVCSFQCLNQWDSPQILRTNLAQHFLASLKLSPETPHAEAEQCCAKQRHLDR